MSFDDPPTQVSVNFEGFPSFTPLPDTTYAAQGVTITGATVLTFPKYNWADYPAHSGNSVISGPVADDEGGSPVTVGLHFAHSLTHVGIFVTARDPVTLTCTSAVGAILGTKSSRAPNLDEEPPYSVYPPNDFVEVVSAGIADCTIVGPQNFFVLDDLRAGNECVANVCQKADSIDFSATMTVSRVQTLPVLSPCFDAKTQMARTWRCASRDDRTDTVVVHIHAGYSDTTKVNGVSVILHSKYERLGRDHSHPASWGTDSLINSRFIDIDADVSDPASGTPRTRWITLGPSGDTTIVFRTTGVAGTEHLTLTVDSATLAPLTKKVNLPVTQNVVALVTGLEELADAPSVHKFGVTPAHPLNHWGTPEMNRLLTKVADSVAALARRIDSLPPRRRPSGTYPTQLGVNDMSLPNGGVFDIDTVHAAGAWREPHKTHRDGQHADVDIRQTTDYNPLSDYVKTLWQDKWGLKFVDERSTLNHVHLANQATTSTAPAGVRMQSIGATIAICASLACSSPAAAPQQTTVQSDTVTVAVDSVWREGDKIAVAYHVSLGAQWTGNLYSFLVQPGVPLQSIATDGPDHWIDGKSTYDGRDAIEWTALAAEDRPTTGQALGGFVLKTRAILGAVPFMAMPYEPPVLTSEDQLGDTLHIKPFWTRGRSGTVLGPAAPLPANPTDRAAQLTTDVTGWCSADTSVPRGICESLSNKAGDVRTAAASSDQGQLTQAVRVFRSELDAQRGKHVSETVYWRLVADLLMVAQ